MANQKRISELPIINTLSGSAASVIPVVVGGTTNQISAENFSKFVNAYNATTSSNTFIGNQTITGDLDISGNAIIGGDVEVAGMITAQQYNVTYVSSSIQYQSGSTEFGDTADDTHTFTGTILLNGSAIGFGELNAQTASQDSINFGISIVTSSIDSHILGVSEQTASQDSINFGISIVTSSIDAHILGVSEQTSSQNSINSGISAVTGAFAVELGSVDSHILGVSQQTASQDLVNLGISSVTGSLIGITNGLMAFTAALDDNYATDAQLYKLYQATRSLEIQTGSQNSINSGISAVTGAFATELGGIQNNITSFNSVFGGVSAVTGAFATELGQLQTQNTSQGGVNSGISAVTGAFATELGSIDSHILKQATQTGSQDLVNLGISSVTGSLIGITNGLMAFTAALDSNYATDAQLYQLYQSTRSLEIQTGSQNSINSGISAVTGAFATELSGIQNNITSFNNVFGGVSAVTGAFATEFGSVDSHILGISTYTSSQNIINTSVDSHILKQATQTGSQDLVNLGISTFTGSLRGEVNGIEAYTASLKGAIEVNGQDVNVLGMITAQQFNVTLVSSSVMYQSGSTKFGDTSDDIHEFTGSKFEVYNPNASGTMYAVVRNNRARNAAIRTTTTNGSFIAGTSIGTDTFQYQIYDEVEGVNRVTINSQGGTTLQGAVTASQTLTVNNNLIVNAGKSVRLYESTNTNYWDAYTYTDNTLRLNYNGAGNDEVTLLNDGAINFSGNITASSVFTAKSNAGDVVGGYFTNPAANSGAESVSLAFGLNRSGGDFVRQVKAITFGAEQQWTGTPSTVDGYLAFSTVKDEVVSEAARFNSDGNLTLSTGNLVIGTSGKGIDFSATSNGSGTTTSELLDDYERGTFTPQVADAETGGNVAAGGTFNGVYTKIGNQVTVVMQNANIDTTGMTSGNDLWIRNLPFTSGGFTGSPLWIGATRVSAITASANSLGFQTQMAENASAVRIMEMIDSANSAAILVSSINSGASDIWITLTYFTN